MSKRTKFKQHIYQNPFQSPHANPKHAYHQVNGETRRTVNLIILEHETRKRS
ncbi:YpzG family protein [Calidifontibacillus oryziterrae]|uniref:YpzG family protein n=1 Tax=Calidifontibacillus oryziterrae TaxID=1191699 RepID=UPI00037DF803|nr:YpzG family protein [Calidifontibacillus oryziterrae]